MTGDVVLIEQQTSAFDGYCPMEYVPSVFDAIQWLVAENINVVEPSANGSQDLMQNDGKVRSSDNPGSVP